jgi:alpha-glucosidase
MFFTKYPHRANFSFADDYDEDSGLLTIGGRQFGAKVEAYEGDVYHVVVSSPERWPGGNKCLVPPNHPPSCQRHRLKAGDRFALQLLGKDGHPIVAGVAEEPFGVSGQAWMFQLAVGEDALFYGMGEKFFGQIELSGIRTKFWNTDVWADFHFGQLAENPSDPPYFTTPYVAVHTGGEWVGILVNNPYPVFIETPGTDESRVFVEWQRTSRNLVVGSEGGQPDMYVIYGPTLPELTRKLQKLVGVTPLPPIWSLGYHQSKWGYAGHDDLLRVDAEFAKHEIPCDGLWMDLEHMRGFRIFNTSQEAFPDGAQATADALAKNDRKIVPILDPGVKFEPGYNVYDDGHQKKVFCRNVEGKEFIGLVWPGETVYPDFTTEQGREWWAGYAKAWREEGFSATWVDMNDPSTGPVDPTGMLFRNGTEPHEAFHNQYALGMQMATRDGFLQARPNERPFILSRSGFTGTSRYAAVWSGDNLANRFYLRNSIPTALGMSISGLPFNGPDIGGFGGDCPEDLMLDWVKAGFLFPFFRNHSIKEAKPQEPFAYPSATMQLLRRYIRLRYKLIPYLYNLFMDQEEQGDPILRPLVYEFDDPGVAKTSDQFMVGPWVMQAPFLDENEDSRTVALPGSEPWYDARTGEWRLPGSAIVRNRRSETPLFVRAGAIIPMQKGTPVDNRKELREVAMHVFVPNGWSGDSEILYRADDGISHAYSSGARSAMKVTLAAVNGHLAITTQQEQDGFGKIAPTFVIHGAPASFALNGKHVELTEDKAVLVGRALPVQVVEGGAGETAKRKPKKR